MLQQSQGAVEIVSSEACEHHMLPLPKGYQQHLIGSCIIERLAVTPCMLLQLHMSRAGGDKADAQILTF